MPTVLFKTCSLSMKAEIEHKGKSFKVDLNQPIDISIPLRAGNDNVNAWYVNPMQIEPVMTDRFTGDVTLGGAVNFRNIKFNPHGNGTHTECLGHISKEPYTINNVLNKFFFLAEVISVSPNNSGEITKAEIEHKVKTKADAVVIRTLPNNEEKLTYQYSNTNPPFITPQAMQWLVDFGFNHLLIDLPSVDPEFDDGKLTAHHIFWNYPKAPQTHRTITELIYVPDSVADGQYLLNIQIASFENDASPSKPLLFQLIS